MTVLMTRFTLKPESIAAFEQSLQRLFAAIAHAQTPGMRYTVCRHADGQTYTGILALEDGRENPLPGLREGQAFLEHLPAWSAHPPVRETLQIVGTYRVF